jgi:glycosyltransferase involved in cell wall biosynthesis
MEYMALGKPIVQFDLAEGRYSAQSASLYARQNDAWDFALKICELLDNPEQRRQMGEFGRRRVVDELEWRHEVPKLLAAYETLWAPKNRGQGANTPKSAKSPRNSVLGS